MKRILLFLSMLLCLTASTLAQCPWPPHGGNNNPPKPEPPTPRPAADASSMGHRSGDPNEIVGPIGYDSVRWVSINDVLNYTIMFENDPEIANAPAQMIDIRFGFPNKTWMKGFGIGSYCFSNMSFNVENASNAYQQRINLRDSLGIFVDVIGGLDVVNQQGFWNFSTIDPETGYAPWQVDKGMLPVNDETHIGEGFVTFQLKPYNELKTGDTISIQANILFDQNDTIPTNRWCNKIDAGLPESRLIAELHPTLQDVYNLKFTGKDDEGGSGVSHILLYLANHSGIYEEIDTCMIDSVLAFPVEKGKQYKLYTIAVDNTGNREPTKTEPDVVLNFSLPPTDIQLSDSVFQDDLAIGGYIGSLSSVDTEDGKTYTYALAEGSGAIHNDLFQITDDQLQVKQSFKCAKDSVYKIRISSTDNSGMSFSKAFSLQMKSVLDRPKIDSLEICICEGDVYNFHGKEYEKAGIYTYSKENEYMCDSVFVLTLTVNQKPEAPQVSFEGTHTLVSSAVKGNQWFKDDGTPIEGATDQYFTPKEDGIYYVALSNGACYSSPSNRYQVKLSNHIDLFLDLKQGWNWISSNLSEAEHQDAKKFLSPIESFTERFVGKNEQLIKEPVSGLTGNLSTISPKELYKVFASDDIAHSWSGNGVLPQESPIELQKGWNWIGYTPSGSLEIERALANLSPSDNDIIKCIDGFSTYSSGRWIGTINRMNPGEGYMYFSAKNIDFSYPNSSIYSVGRAEDGSDPYSPWNYNRYAYPDNTTMIAALQIENTKTLEGTFTIGAFCGNECRGVSRNVGERTFLTIHGELSNNDKVTFKAIENATGKEFDIIEKIRFEGQHEGTIDNPFVFHANKTTVINDVEDMDLSVYPRPLRSKLYVNGNTNQIKYIKILAVNGAVAISNEGYPEQGIDVSKLVPGVYVVAIISSNGNVHYEKVIKAQYN